MRDVLKVKPPEKEKEKKTADGKRPR